jgi:multidrug resistance efflux pump
VVEIMAEKKLKISLDFDSKDFERGVKEAMQKLNDYNKNPKQTQVQMQLDQRLKSMGYEGLPGAPSYQKMEQERKKTEQEKIAFINKTFDEYKKINTQLINEKKTEEEASEAKASEAKASEEKEASEAEEE